MKYEDYYSPLNPTKVIFDSVTSPELSLYENIVTLNKISNMNLSNEFYKLYTIFEKPNITAWTATVFVWNSIGKTAQIMFSVFWLCVIIGGTVL